MEPGRFDDLTRTFARPTSRRGALRRLLGGGLTAALLGPSAQRALAQDATPAATMAAGTELCLFPFEATVRRGPDAGLSLAGLLALGLTPAGAVDHGQLVKADGSAVPVVGQVNGRAVNLPFTLGTGKVIYGAGTAQHSVAGCQPGTLGGPLVGPVPGDSGDWTVLQLQATPGTADACSQCLDANNCTVRPGTDACKSCLATYCR